MGGMLNIDKEALAEIIINLTESNVYLHFDYTAKLCEVDTSVAEEDVNIDNIIDDLKKLFDDYEIKAMD